MYLNLEIFSNYCTEILYRDPSSSVGGKNSYSQNSCGKIYCV